MKYLSMLYLFLFFNLSIHTQQLLVAVLMVKNEAPVMELTLQPLVDAGITDFLVYDTGSTDDTIQVTQDFFQKNNINNFVIEQGPWIDFAASRNQALELTEQYFPEATFMLMLDAEWILHNGCELLKFCELEKKQKKSLYFIKLISQDTTFYHARLIRCKEKVAFVGKVHEVPNVIAQGYAPEKVYINFEPTDYGFEKSSVRLLKDKELLLQQIEANENIARAMYFLGYTYFALGQYQESIKWYEYRLQTSGYDEETYLTMYALADVYKTVGNFEKMIALYFKAFNMRPHRIEPLVKLAAYFYQQKAYELCYLFARHACTIPYPSGEVSLVDNQAYTFDRYALLSATAYMFGDIGLGLQATVKALENHADQKFLHHNLAFYQNLYLKKG